MLGTQYNIKLVQKFKITGRKGKIVLSFEQNIQRNKIHTKTVVCVTVCYIICYII